MKYKETIDKVKYPLRKMSVINEAWRRVRKDRGFVKSNIGFDLYEENCWNMTKEVFTNNEIGHKRENGEFNDAEMAREVIQKYGLNENNIRIIYTDGSRTEEGQATGVAIVEEEEDEGFYFAPSDRSRPYV